MKERNIVALLALLLLAACPDALSAPENLIANGGFEEYDLGILSMWSPEAYENTPEAVRFFVVDAERHSGKRSFAIASMKANDARAIQWVRVKPSTVYKLSCWMQARDVVSEGIGANISVVGSMNAAGDFKDTKGRWAYVEMYGKTGPAQHSLGVMIRLGFYGSRAVGMALFDDVAMEELSAPPAGPAEVIDFSSNAGGSIPIRQASPVILHGPSGFVALWMFYIVLGVLAVAVAALSLVMVRARVKSRSKPIPYRGVEHRASIRSPSAARVTLRKSRARGTASVIHMTAENIAENGIYLRCEDPSVLRLHDELTLKATIEGRSVSLGKAMVVRIHTAHNTRGKTLRCGIGLRFTTGSRAALKARKTLTERPAG